MEAQGNERPTRVVPETSLATMPMGADSGTATARAALTKKARVDAENFMMTALESGAWKEVEVRKKLYGSGLEHEVSLRRWKLSIANVEEIHGFL